MKNGQERYNHGSSTPVDWHMKMRDNRKFMDLQDNRSEKNVCILCGKRHGPGTACTIDFWNYSDGSEKARNGAYSGPCEVRTVPFGLCLTPAIESMGRLGQKNWARARREGHV